MKFPFYKQLDAMDCGPTALQMVSKYYGKYYALPFLREISYIDREGVSLKGISEAADRIGLTTLAVKIPLSGKADEPSLMQAPLPAILHWNGNHFVVVYKLTKKHAWIADPASGKYKLTIEQLKNSWLANGKEGIALLLEPSITFNQGDEEEQAVSGFGFLKHYCSIILIWIVLSSCLQKPYLEDPFFDKKVTPGCLDFYVNANKAYCLLLSGDTIEATNLFSEAFDLREFGCSNSVRRNDMYLYVKCLLKIGNDSLAAKYLNTAVFKTGLELEQVLSDSLLIQFKNKKLYHNFEEQYDSLHFAWKNSINWELKKTVDSMVVLDQLYRGLSGFSDSLKVLQKEIDKSNEIELAKIIKEQGFPGYSQIGTNDAFILFLHVPISFRDSIFPILVQEVDKGNASPGVVAAMIDQMMFRVSKVQRYGTGLRQNGLGDLELLPFEKSDLNIINTYRAKIGLISLECDMKEQGFVLPYFFNEKF